MAFIDFEKAYDRVPHTLLMNKIHVLGIGGKLFQIIKNLYKDNYIKLRINNRYTERIRYAIGVRQGCPVSPILFNLYINNIFDGMEGICIEGTVNPLRGLLFADGTVIFAETPDQLQHNLGILHNWCKDNRMSVNSRKCGIMCIGDIEGSTQEMSIGEKIIQPVHEYLYLGILIQDTLCMNTNICLRARKGRAVLGCLKGLLCNRLLPIVARKRLVTVILRPILCYGSELFGMNKILVQPLEAVLSATLRTIVAAKKNNSCYSRLLTELYIESIYEYSSRMRLRGLLKWKKSNILIGLLVRQIPTGRLRTWVSGGYTWMRSNARSIIEDADIKKTERLKVLLFENRRRSDDSQICRNILEWGVKNTSTVWNQVSRINEHGISWDFLLRIRSGAVYWAPRLAVIGHIRMEFKEKCPGCGMLIKESALYVLMECRAYSVARVKLMQTLSTIDDNEIVLSMNMLLGEQWNGSDPYQKRKLTELGKFLKEVLYLRIRLLELASV